MRSCVICGQCNEPISYPHLTPIEGIIFNKQFNYWEVYHEGIFIGWYQTEEVARDDYNRKINLHRVDGQNMLSL